MLNHRSARIRSVLDLPLHLLLRRDVEIDPAPGVQREGEGLQLGFGTSPGEVRIDVEGEGEEIVADAATFATRAFPGVEIVNDARVSVRPASSVTIVRNMVGMPPVTTKGWVSVASSTDTGPASSWSGTS